MGGGGRAAPRRRVRERGRGGAEVNRPGGRGRYGGCRAPGQVRPLGARRPRARAFPPLSLLRLPLRGRAGSDPAGRPWPLPPPASLPVPPSRAGRPGAPRCCVTATHGIEGRWRAGRGEVQARRDAKGGSGSSARCAPASPQRREGDGRPALAAADRLLSRQLVGPRTIFPPRRSGGQPGGQSSSAGMKDRTGQPPLPPPAHVCPRVPPAPPRLGCSPALKQHFSH